MSHIGQQFIAPDGMGVLDNQHTYHYLGRSPQFSRALLCYFDEPPSVHLVWVGLQEYESALINKRIIVHPEQKTLPPWLEVLEGKIIEQIDDLNTRKKRKSNEERIKERLKKIEPLLKKQKQILKSENPFSLIDKYARNHKPSINQKSARLWFFTYVCFGCSKWALTPAFPNCGRGKRTEKAGPKLGCPSYRGKFSGYRCTSAMRDEICTSYMARKKLGRFLTSIYVVSMSKDFGCKSRPFNKGRDYEIYHPSGKPFPTYDQYKYVIHKRIGRDQVQMYLYGETRKRVKASASKGSFTESVSHLLERVEGDAYYLKEVPRGPLSGEPMPPMSIVRLRCFFSGYLVGIGFSYGHERAAAYKMALFSMAIPKTEFCRYFGLEISDEAWPGVGIPPWLKIDRGPGASKELIKEFEERIPITELAPSYEGQSKAVIESSHPKDLKFEGAPMWKKSNLDYVELAKREILRAIKDNNKIDVSARITPSTANLMPTPINLWRYYDERCRTVALPMRFESAVCNLLQAVELTVCEDGVYLEGQRYYSQALSETGMCEKVITQGRYRVWAYTLGVVARRLWVDYQGQLIAVDVLLKVITDDAETHLSLPMLEEINKLRKLQKTKLKDHRLAVELEAMDQFEQETGKDWDGSTLCKGKPKRGTKKARSEYSVVKDVVLGRS